MAYIITDEGGTVHSEIEYKREAEAYLFLQQQILEKKGYKTIRRNKQVLSMSKNQEIYHLFIDKKKNKFNKFQEGSEFYV